jgi:hypothetical protein
MGENLTGRAQSPVSCWEALHLSLLVSDDRKLWTLPLLLLVPQAQFSSFTGVASVSSLLLVPAMWQCGLFTHLQREAPIASLGCHEGSRAQGAQKVASSLFLLQPHRIPGCSAPAPFPPALRPELLV